MAFLGTLALMPLFGATINIISLFGFILVLGIVVDDAIVTGENIFRRLQANPGGDTRNTVIAATQEVSTPVTFGVLTTVVAFVPFSLVDGRIGTIFTQIPYAVIPVLLLSLVESKPAFCQRIYVMCRWGSATTPYDALAATHR